MNNFFTAINNIPIYGVGLGLRREFDKYLLDNDFSKLNPINILEIIPENYINVGGKAQDRLYRASQIYQLTSHGVNLSIASCDDLNINYLKSLKEFVIKYNIEWFSDHLCFTSIENKYMHELMPFPFNEESLEHLIPRIVFVQNYVGKPFLVENISYYVQFDESCMTEPDFMTQLLEKADCGLLLDVNNIYVNSCNFKFDPYQFIDNMPLDRVVQIHIAGHSNNTDLVIDTHGNSIIDEVYSLLEYTLNKCQPKAITLERDQNYPPFDEIIFELNKINTIFFKQTLYFFTNSILEKQSQT